MKEIFDIIISVIVAIASVASFCYTLRHNKQCIQNRIARKEAKYNSLYTQIQKQYGQDGKPAGMPITKEDKRMMQLKQEIEELKKEL